MDYKKVFKKTHNDLDRFNSYHLLKYLMYIEMNFNKYLLNYKIHYFLDYYFLLLLDKLTII